MITRGLPRNRQKSQHPKREAEAAVMHFGDGGRGHEQRNAGSLWKLEKANRFFPSSLQKITALLTLRF